MLTLHLLEPTLVGVLVYYICLGISAVCVVPLALHMLIIIKGLFSGTILLVNAQKTDNDWIITKQTPNGNVVKFVPIKKSIFGCTWEIHDMSCEGADCTCRAGSRDMLTYLYTNTNLIENIPEDVRMSWEQTIEEAAASGRALDEPTHLVVTGFLYWLGNYRICPIGEIKIATRPRTEQTSIVFTSKESYKTRANRPAKVNLVKTLPAVGVLPIVSSSFVDVKELVVNNSIIQHAENMYIAGIALVAIGLLCLVAALIVSYATRSQTHMKRAGITASLLSLGSVGIGGALVRVSFSSWTGHFTVSTYLGIVAGSIFAIVCIAAAIMINTHVVLKTKVTEMFMIPGYENIFTEILALVASLAATVSKSRARTVMFALFVVLLMITSASATPVGVNSFDAAPPLSTFKRVHIAKVDLTHGVAETLDKLQGHIDFIHKYPTRFQETDFTSTLLVDEGMWKINLTSCETHSQRKRASPGKIVEIRNGAACCGNGCIVYDPDPDSDACDGARTPAAKSTATVVSCFGDTIKCPTSMWNDEAACKAWEDRFLGHYVSFTFSLFDYQLFRFRKEVLPTLEDVVEKLREQADKFHLLNKVKTRDLKFFGAIADGFKSLFKSEESNKAVCDHGKCYTYDDLENNFESLHKSMKLTVSAMESVIDEQRAYNRKLANAIFQVAGSIMHERMFNWLTTMSTNIAQTVRSTQHWLDQVAAWGTPVGAKGYDQMSHIKMTRWVKDRFASGADPVTQSGYSYFKQGNEVYHFLTYYTSEDEHTCTMYALSALNHCAGREGVCTCVTGVPDIVVGCDGDLQTTNNDGCYGDISNDLEYCLLSRHEAVENIGTIAHLAGPIYDVVHVGVETESMYCEDGPPSQSTIVNGENVVVSNPTQQPVTITHENGTVIDRSPIIILRFGSFVSYTIDNVEHFSPPAPINGEEFLIVPPSFDSLKVPDLSFHLKPLSLRPPGFNRAGLLLRRARGHLNDMVVTLYGTGKPSDYKSSSGILGDLFGGIGDVAKGLGSLTESVVGTALDVAQGVVSTVKDIADLGLGLGGFATTALIIGAAVIGVWLLMQSKGRGKVGVLSRYAAPEAVNRGRIPLGAV